MFWWGVSKPIIHRGPAYIGFAKVGRFGEGFMARSEGAFLHSENILRENDPAEVLWETLPEGNVGLRAPAFVRRLSGGRYLLWYHNNGTRWYNNGPTTGNRNVAWLAGGREQDGFIHWGQPEIVLYHDEFPCGSSYPDFVETGDGSLSIVSTQKTEARVVDVDPQLLNGLWSAQARVPLEGLVLDPPGWQPRPSSEAVPPQGGGELPRRRGRSPAGSPRRTPAGRTRSPGCLGRAIT